MHQMRIRPEERLTPWFTGQRLSPWVAKRRLLRREAGTASVPRGLGGEADELQEEGV
jgi:hypothetical protein